MNDDEVKRVVDILEEACHRSRRSRRELERAIGVANGYLSHLFAGRLELKIRHAIQLTRELGIGPGRFFREAFPEPGGGPGRPGGRQRAALPPTPSQPAAPAPAVPSPVSSLLSEIIRAELLKLLTEEVAATAVERPEPGPRKNKKDK